MVNCLFPVSCGRVPTDSAPSRSSSKLLPRPEWGALKGYGGSRVLSVLVLLFLTIFVVAGVNPTFLSVQNFRDLLVQAAPVIIVGCGMTLVVLTGEIDISVGSLFGLLAVILGLFSSPTHHDLPIAAVVSIALLVGTLVGLLNGILVTVARVPSIIATLGMLTILRGVAEIILEGDTITDLPPALREFGIGTLAGAPWCLWVAAMVVILSSLLLRRTRLGLRVYAVGGNPDAAAFARISVTRIKLFAFAFTGFLTAVAAVFIVPQQSVVDAGIGSGFELVIVTAVLVGGASIRGGVGGIAGTVIAAILLGSIRTALVFLKIGDMATYWERAIQGAFILGAVLSDNMSSITSRFRSSLRSRA